MDIKQPSGIGMLITVELAIFTADLALGPEISLWVFYGLPVIFGTLALEEDVGLGLAAFAGALIVLSVLVVGHPFGSAFYAAVAVCSRLMALILFSLLARMARKPVLDFIHSMDSTA